MKKIKAVSFLEIVISLTLIVVAWVGVMGFFEVGMNAIYRSRRQISAVNLAKSLMVEVMTKAFVDPDDPTNTALGINTGESSSNRPGYDDVDDFNGWDRTPPENIAGQVMDGSGAPPTPDYRDFRRMVVVDYVDQDMNFSASPTDFKRIRITVTGKKIKDVELVEVKANVE